MTKKETEINNLKKVLVMFNCPDEDMEIINCSDNLDVIKLVFKMVLFGIASVDIKSIIDKTEDPDTIAAVMNDRVASKYVDTDKLSKEVKVTTATVEKNNQDMREMLEVLKKVIEDNEKKAQETAALYKDLSEMKSNSVDELKNLNREYKSRIEVLTNENEDLLRQVETYKNKLIKTSNVPVKEESNYEKLVKAYVPEPKQPKGLFKKKSKHEEEDRLRIYKKFISEILSNEKFQQDQKDYLSQCLLEHVPFYVIDMFAEPGITVEQMKMLREYYEKNLM